MTLNEQDLDRLRRICAGDKLAEKELMDKYREPIKIYFITKRLARADVEDLCQDVLLIILQKARDCEVELRKPDFRNFVSGICWNKFCEFLRKKILKGKVSAHSETSFDPADEVPPPIFDEQEQQVQLEIIMKLFQSLPPLHQNILWDYWVNEMSGKAANKKYGISVDLSRIRKPLKITSRASWSNGIVPFRTRSMFFDVQGFHFVVINLNAFEILLFN